MKNLCGKKKYPNFSPESLADEERAIKFLPGWLGGGDVKEGVQMNRYLPASLQVLEHTALQVNGTWGDEGVLQRGARPLFEEMKPLPGLVRLTYLRNSLLMEARVAKLEQFNGYTPEVEKTLQTTSESPLPEQLATVLDHTVRSGELKSMEKSKGSEITELTNDVIKELRDPTTDLSQALSQFQALRYS